MPNNVEFQGLSSAYTHKQLNIFNHKMCCIAIFYLYRLRPLRHTDTVPLSI